MKPNHWGYVLCIYHFDLHVSICVVCIVSWNEKVMNVRACACTNCLYLHVYCRSDCIFETGKSRYIHTHAVNADAEMFQGYRCACTGHATISKPTVHHLGSKFTQIILHKETVPWALSLPASVLNSSSRFDLNQKLASVTVIVRSTSLNPCNRDSVFLSFVFNEYKDILICSEHVHNR
jgi:hypothetical protein